MSLVKITLLLFRLQLALLLLLPPNAFSSDLVIHNKLSSWGFYQLINKKIRLSSELRTYTLNVPLFTDHAWKWRAIYLPNGTHLVNSSGTYPEHTILIKTFFYPISPTDKRLTLTQQPTKPFQELDLEKAKLIETRLLYRDEGKWIPLNYIWNEDSTEAYLTLAGNDIDLVSSSGESFTYSIPSKGQCSECHSGFSENNRMEPLGHSPSDLPQLINDNSSILRPLKKGHRFSQSDLQNSLAREYLHINCAHCHNPLGQANSSRLFLERDRQLSSSLGLCKIPIAAGRGSGDLRYGIHPGRSDQSIMVYRMNSREADIQMPEIGRTLIDEYGVKLISNWIDNLPSFHDCKTDK